MTDAAPYRPDDIMRMFGIDYEQDEFAKGGSMPQPSADDAVRVVVSPAEHITEPDRAEALGLTVDAKRMRGYGDIVIKTNYLDGTIVVEYSDDVIAVSAALLAQIDPRHINDDGLFVADTAGEYIYRPIRFAEQGRVVVCERVR